MSFSSLIDKKIRNAFSDAAVQYDILTQLHKEIGRELIKKTLMKDQCRRILDVGMGTGWLTSRLTYYFPESQVVGVDFAPGMIDQAKQKGEGFDILQADAVHLPFKDKCFDIIISNLAYQWVKKLPEAFDQAYTKLNEDGLLSCTLFGQGTLEELYTSFMHAYNGQGEKNRFPLRRLASRDQIKAALKQSGFKHVQIDYERIKVNFPNMLDLLKWLKNIGANMIERDIFIGRTLISKASQLYEEKYKDRFGIFATFEVVWVQANK